MLTAACTSEGLQLTDVFFSKIVYLLVMVFLLVSCVLLLLVKVILKLLKDTQDFKWFKCSIRLYL